MRNNNHHHQHYYHNYYHHRLYPVRIIPRIPILPIFYCYTLFVILTMLLSMSSIAANPTLFSKTRSIFHSFARRVSPFSQLTSSSSSSYSSSYSSLTSSLTSSSSGNTIIFILGGPGSGKGTVSSSLAKEYGMQHISAGQLLRDAIASKSSHGALIDRICKEGNIVPSYITVDLLQKEMKKHPSCRYLIDGFPRNMENYGMWLQSPLSNPKNDAVLVLRCPQETLLTRLQLRSEVSGRADDNLDTIKNRFQVFDLETEPVIQQFQSHHRSMEVLAADTQDIVFSSVKSLLWKCLFSRELVAMQDIIKQCFETKQWRQIIDSEMLSSDCTLVKATISKETGSTTYALSDLSSLLSNSDIYRIQAIPEFIELPTLLPGSSTRATARIVFNVIMNPSRRPMQTSTQRLVLDLEFRVIRGFWKVSSMNVTF